MSDDIITSNLETEFKLAKGAKQGNLPGGGYQLRSSLIDKGELPPPIQRRMKKQGIMNLENGSLPAMGNIRSEGSMFYHPLFTNLNMMIPRDRRERNEWCRHFYRVEPIIGTAIDLHTEFPISDFNNVSYDPSIKAFFDYMAFEQLDIINLLLEIGLEYWKVGDVFPFGQLNEVDGMWQRFVLLNPDFIDIKSSIFAEDPVIELIPDQTVKAIVAAGPRGEFAEIYNQLPEDVVRQVRMGKNIKLDSRLVSHIAFKASQYETWGTPMMMRCFKTLIYKDILRDAQISIAHRHITPLRIFKIGAPGEPMPNQGDIDALRDMLAQVENDPNGILVYHYGIQTDYVGSTGKILPLNTEFDFIQKELMNGLGINQAMLNGEGPTYANAQVGLKALSQRYLSYRYRLESWIRHKVYKPIAEIQGFYKPVNGEISTAHLSEKEIRRLAAKKDMQLIVPDITWQQQDLTDNQSILNFVQQLQAKGLISMTTVLPMLNLDPETEKRNLERERGSVFDTNAPKTGPLPNQGGNLGTVPSPSVGRTQSPEGMPSTPTTVGPTKAPTPPGGTNGPAPNRTPAPGAGAGPSPLPTSFTSAPSAPAEATEDKKMVRQGGIKNFFPQLPRVTTSGMPSRVHFGRLIGNPWDKPLKLR